MTIRLTVAGRVGIESGGCVAGAGLGQHGRLVLAYLATERHRPVAKDELAELLWGDDLPRSWEQLVRGAIAKVRVTFDEAGLDGSRAVATLPGAYQLELPPAVVVDVEEAERAVEASAAALAGGDVVAAAAYADGAVAVASRTFLPGHGGVWVEQRQAALRELNLRALEARAKAALAAREWPDAIAAASACVAIEPFRESAHLLLITAHERAGNRGEALRAYERCRHALADELGVSPSPATEAAYLALIGDEPAGDREPFPLPKALLANTVVVGRDAEARRLAAALARATDEGRQAVFVSGEPGIGKTTLVARFAREAHAGGATVLYGRCDEELGLSYEPFGQAIGHYVAHAPATDLDAHVTVHGGALTRLAPQLGRRLGGEPAPDSTDPEADRYRLFEAVGGLLGAAASRAPLVVVLDDLHWAAAPGLLLLRHVMQATAGSPVLVVGTYRPTDVEPGHPLLAMLADLRRDAAVERIELEGLDLDGMAELVRTRATGDGRGLAEAVHTHTGGNPFFAGELLRHLQETGAVYRRDGPWTYFSADGQVGVPAGVREVVGRRLQALPETTQQALVWASVIGAEFDLDLVERVMPALAGDAVLDAVEAALRVGLVGEQGAGRYRFSHALARDSVYSTLSATRRARCHRAVAEGIAAQPQDDGRLPSLVHHYAEAGDGAKAADYAVAAAQQAFANSAWEDAVTFLERALAALPADDLERQCDLLLMIAETWTRFWDIPKAREAASTAWRLAETLGSAFRRAKAARWYLTVTTPDASDVARAEAALAALGGDRPEVAACVLARLALKSDDDVLSARALAMARASGDGETLGPALWVRSWVLAKTERAKERLAIAEELVTAAPPRGWDGWRGGHEQRGVARLVLGDRDGFEADAAACDRVGAERRFWYYRCRAVIWRGTSALLDGRFDDADRFIREADELNRSMFETPPADLFAIQLARLALDRGHPERAVEVLRDGLRHWSPHAVLEPMLAHALAESGDLGAALELFDALATHDFQPVKRLLTGGLAYLAEVAAAAADAERAQEVYRGFVPFAGQAVAAGAAAHCPGAVDRYLGQLAATLHRWDDAVAHYEVALLVERGLRAPPLVARTQYWYGRMLVERGNAADAAKARELLGESQRTAASLGMTRLEGQASDLLGGPLRHLYAAPTGHP